MQAYRFKDEKSDKFWRIECAGAAFAVNYGKTGTTGTYQVKEFDNPVDCEKEAGKLIASKTKKGYQPYPEFDPDRHCYFDDNEIGLHPLTSHPRFRACFTEALYYDCVDEEAPFGSDEGHDTLSHIEEDMRKSPDFDFAAFPKKLIETCWDMTYLPADSLAPEDVKKLAETDEMDLIQSDQVTYAAAFAQIKITGQIDPSLKALALNAMKRMQMTAEILGWLKPGQLSEITERMLADLAAFEGGG